MLLSFVIGSIPFGIIIAKTRGVDLKRVGSGNIGTTNVLRAMGKWPAAMTLLGDALKGTAAVAIGRYLVGGTLYESIAGVSVILGHNFSLFLGFKGGKGVATSLGVLLIYAPKAALATAILWVLVAVFTKYSSLGAIVSFGLLPVNVILLNYDRTRFFVSLFITLLILLRHRDNIQNLIKGAERKIGGRA